MSRAYRIWAPPYRHRSGGVRALHRLAALLKEKGFEATIKEKPKNKDYVAVYPETVGEINPWGARHMVRYLLHRPGVVGGPKSYPDYVQRFCYHEMYRVSGDEPLLTIQTIELDLFNLQGAGPRNTTSAWIGRAEKRGYLSGPPVGETLIQHNWPSSRRGVADLLKRSKVFYTYEPFTALMTEAGLCGCPTIIMTDMAKYPISRKEIAERAWNPLGAGWGMGELEKAKESLPQVLPHYLAMEERMKEQLKGFIEITQSM